MNPPLQNSARNDSDPKDPVAGDKEDINSDDAAVVCGTPLFKNFASTPSPIRKYAVQDLYSWLAHLFSREGIEQALEQTALKSQSPYDASADMFDIQDSRIWKEFLDTRGDQFNAHSGNVTFGMFTDGINPFGSRQAGKHVSVTFIIMVCMSLPVSLRYRPENIFLAGIAPGPKEPSLEQVNWILRPVVEQLKRLWTSGLRLSKTYEHPQGRLIHAALLPFFADLPALRRSLGFASHNARRMCSYCLLPRKEIKNIDMKTWPPRDLDEHRRWAKKSRNATTLGEKKKIREDQGVRYTVMLELPYWDILQYHVVDSMHNLLLGLLKWNCQRFWQMADKDDNKYPGEVSPQERADLRADGNTNHPASSTSPPTVEVSSEIFLDVLGSTTDSTDDDYVLLIEGGEWGGKWLPPPDSKIIFDGKLLQKINLMLKRIHIPTWIKQAIPVLGKASFGRLKADEWRNLFTVQLPLLLPHLWGDGD